MNCNRVQSALSAFLDGELRSSEMLAIRRHIGTCPECAQELEVTRAIQEMIAVDDNFAPPADFEGRLMAHVFGESKPVERPRYRLTFGLVSLAAAAAIFCAVLVDRSMTPQPKALTDAPIKSSFDMNRDQAYAAGYDGIGGLQVALPASNEPR